MSYRDLTVGELAELRESAEEFLELMKETIKKGPEEHDWDEQDWIHLLRREELLKSAITKLGGRVS